MCNKEYDILGVLRYHKRTVHDGRNDYCDVCGKEYRSKEDLKAHMRTIHHKMSFVASTIKKQLFHFCCLFKSDPVPGKGFKKLILNWISL